MTIIKNGILLVMAVALTGCATSARSNKIAFGVRSDPSGCPVEVNGINMGETPTTIHLGASKHWVGLFNSPDGWEYGGQMYHVTCFPPPNAKGPLTSQTKVISPGMIPKGGDLFFNLRLRPVNPAQPIQIETKGKEEITIKTERAEDARDRLRKLKALLDDGLITKDEYDSKRQEILKSL